MTVLRPLLVALLLGAIPGSAAGQDSSLERYIRMGLESNRGLAQQEISVRQAEARWTRTRAAYLPSVTVEGRYSRAEGGRTFDVPVGDLLNPVYTTLNQLTGTQQFPTIANRSFDLFRDREQDTRLHVTQVLWNPALGADARSKRYQVDAAHAGTAAARSALVRDIRIAYYTYANARRAEGILEAALDLVIENERSSTAMWEASLATRDKVHRARAERLEVEAELARAVTDWQIAASHLNYLLGRSPDAEIELSPKDLELPATAHSEGLRRAGSPLGDEAWIDDIADQAMSRRPELERLAHAVAAAEAGLDAVRAQTRPSVALALDAGIQGRDYGFGPDQRYLLASLVLSWNVTNGGGEAAAEREAALERDRLRTQREDAAARIRLELETTVHNARVALANVSSSAQRVEEATGAFRLVRRRRDEGLATALEFLDARATLTRAQLNRSISETEALIRLAELDYAAGGRGALLSGFATPASPEGNR